MASDYDVVVVGAGTAGLTAGMYAAQYGLKTAIVERMMGGGQIINAEKIENFPGFPQGVSGAELSALLQEQAMDAGAEFIMVEVTGIALEAFAGGLVISAFYLARISQGCPPAQAQGSQVNGGVVRCRALCAGCGPGIFTTPGRIKTICGGAGIGPGPYASASTPAAGPVGIIGNVKGLVGA